MKKEIYLLIISVSILTACDSNEIQDIVNIPETNVVTGSDLSLRASTLGYPDTITYISYVSQQCMLGNHANCDILDDGTHLPCIHASHSGTTHNGKHHQGTGEITHGNRNHYQNLHDPLTCTDPTHNHPCDPAICTNQSHNHGNNNIHDPLTCTDPTHNRPCDPAICTNQSHNHGNNGIHDPLTCNDPTHNHTHDPATCTNQNHNHGGNNHNGNKHHNK